MSSLQLISFRNIYSVGQSKNYVKNSHRKSPWWILLWLSYTLEPRRNFSLVARCSLKFTRCSLLVVKSLVTRCRSYSLQKFIRYSLQKLLVAKNHSLLVTKFTRYLLQKLFIAKNHSLLVAKNLSSLIKIITSP